LKSQNATSNWGGARTLPFVFTEEGVGQLSAVLKSPIAAIVSVRVQRVFVAMRRYIVANAESYNAILISQGMPQSQRIQELRKVVIMQLQALEPLSMKELPKMN